MMKKYLFSGIIYSLLFFSCSSLKIENVKYGWGGEYFTNPDDSGIVNIPKSSMSFNIIEILKLENLDKKPKEVKLRVIRDEEGYFYITANNFKHVWIFESAESSLKLYEKIELLNGALLEDPKFNEQKPNVKLFLKNGKEFLLNKKGAIVKEENKNE